MPEPAPPGSAPAPSPGAPNLPPLPPFWNESYFWYGVFVLGVSFFGLLMGWKMPDIDMPSGGGGGGGGRSSSGWSFGGK